MHTRVVLRSDRNEYYPRGMRDPEEKRYVTRKVITAQGYARINTFMGVTFSSPSTIQIGDKVMGNPYTERDGASVQRVTVRRVGIARSAAGSLSAIDLTVTYDLDDYFIGEVWSKWQPGRNDSKPSSWGKVFGSPDAAKPESHEKLIPCPGGIYLLVNLHSKEVIELWSAHLQRQKFAERNAVSICERNIMKRFVGVSYAADDGTVNVVHWSQPDRNLRQFDEISERIQRGEARIEGLDVQVQKFSESVDAEEARAALHGEGEDAPEVEDYEPKISIGILMDEVRSSWTQANEQRRMEVLSRLGLKSPGEIRNIQDIGKLQGIIQDLTAE